MVVWGDRDII